MSLSFTQLAVDGFKYWYLLSLVIDRECSREVFSWKLSRHWICYKKFALYLTIA
jgi:hypothetical protein